jgi:2-polyprenyl-3-methyl-5-hydroxy-6-metoxy-1,4-benzoquinol methylase
MSHLEFLQAFAEAQKVPDVQTLLTTYADKYSFQIKSRERAIKVAQELSAVLGIDLKGKRVLDVGCAYGAFTIEFAKLGCHVVGIDVNEKWLKLAEANAQGEADCEFIRCDAATYTARKLLAEAGPFDVVIINDVFEHIYDTAALLDNLVAVMQPGAFIYYKVPNGLATRSVISEGHKKVFAISLLAPDYWQFFVTAPFQIYYRREAYFSALFAEKGFRQIRDQVANTDPNIEHTRRAIRSDISKIKQLLKRDKFADANQYSYAREACKYYIDEVMEDLEKMEWQVLFRKYRATFWSGMLQR